MLPSSRNSRSVPPAQPVPARVPPFIDDAGRGNNRGKGGTPEILNRLLVELEVGVMMVVVMVVVVVLLNYHHNLRLRRIGCCEAEEKHESEQNLFHNSVCRLANLYTELL